MANIADVPPARVKPDESDPRFPLWRRVQDAFLVLPAYFATETQVVGLRATDIFTLSSTFGATIEDQVVETLNRMRSVWDRASEFPLYYFVRQPQTFPDVLLRSGQADDQPVLGIELKAWYLLAKEGAPAARFQQTAAVCSEWDLIAVVPWYLSNVISGTPKVLSPWIESARYAAEYRNYYWCHVRKGGEDCSIRVPTDVSPYPVKSDAIADKPSDDQGGNFGRLARYGLIDRYMEQKNAELIAGIPAVYWREFFKMFSESHTADKVERRMKTLAKRIAKDPKSQKDASDVLSHLADMLESLNLAGE